MSRIRPFVICELCGKEVSNNNIKKHLRRHQEHPESFKERLYKLTHEDLECRFCGKECKNRNSLCNHERLCKENPDRQLQGFAVFVGKRIPWNKGLTKETDDRVLKGNLTYRKNQLDGKHCMMHGDLNPSHRPEVRQKISQTCLEKSRKGQWHKSLAKNMHYLYNGVDLDGSWELAYAKYLDANNITWVRCKDRFLYMYKDKEHYYTPDFYLPLADEYVEIKGYATGKDYAKWKYFPEDKKLVILKEKDLKALGILTN